jgi:hypothetical protein
MLVRNFSASPKSSMLFLSVFSISTTALFTASKLSSYLATGRTKGSRWCVGVRQRSCNAVHQSTYPAGSAVSTQGEAHLGWPHLHASSAAAGRLAPKPSRLCTSFLDDSALTSSSTEPSTMTCCSGCQLRCCRSPEHLGVVLHLPAGVPAGRDQQGIALASIGHKACSRCSGGGPSASDASRATCGPASPGVHCMSQLYVHMVA